MDIENLITETFTAHEHVVPDGDAVLAAARRRIDRRRTVLSRPLAVAAGVAALTLATVTVVALNRSGGTPADQAAAPADTVQVAAPATKTPAEPAVADLTMPFSLDWLPPGSVTYLARRTNIGAASDDPHAPPLYGGEYLFTVTANGQTLDIDVQQMRMVSVDRAAFKSGPGSPVTLNGQRGVESSRSDGPGGYELYLAHPDGGSMYVNVSAHPGSTAPVPQLIDTGRRIAQHIRFPGTTTVTPAFGLRDLPGGLRICAFDIERGPGPYPNQPRSTTRYSLGTCTTMPLVTVGTDSRNTPTGTPGQPVQGHPTRYHDENGYRTLQVLNAVDGNLITVAGPIPLTDLYDLADHLVLPR